MQAVKGLLQMGLTEYEARTYLALLAHPGANGYEAAKRSGVPRAKVYEALESLVQKGAAQTSLDGDRLLYHPLPPEVLLKRHVAAAERLAGQLGPALAEAVQPIAEAPLVTLRGYERLLTRAEEMIGDAAERLFITCYPREMERLGPALIRAERRGVLVFPLVYGAVQLPLCRLYHHPPPSPRRRLTPSLPFLVLVRDHQEALVADAEPGEQAAGLWTQHPTVVLMTAEFIKHDIYLVELSQRLGPHLAEHWEAMRDLQQMWFHNRKDEED